MFEGIILVCLMLSPDARARRRRRGVDVLLLLANFVVFVLSSSVLISYFKPAPQPIPLPPSSITPQRLTKDALTVKTPKTGHSTISTQQPQGQPQKNAHANRERPDSITIPEVQDFLSSFLVKLHECFVANKRSSPVDIYLAFHKLAMETLYPWDRKYLSRMPPRREDNSIFMSLASYRDENCVPTLRAMYEKASNPELLFVGLVQQNCVEDCRTGVLEGGKVETAEPDEDCYDIFCSSEPQHCHNVRVLKVNEPESLGPYSARYFASKLYGGEEWYMQIDSHMTFATGWDKSSIEQLKAAPSQKPVLTHYPPPHTSNLDKQPIAPRICDPLIATSDIEAQIVRLNAAIVYDKVKKVPRFAPFVAAGYFVAHAGFLQEVPFDPLLPWIFMGEEISMSARLWTAGYDMFSPSTSVTGHIYVRRHKPKFWESFGRVFRPGLHNNVQLVVIQRLKNLLGYPECSSDLVKPQEVLDKIEEYGMGTERSMDDYFKMVGLNLAEKTAIAPEWCHRGVPPPGFEEFNDLYK